MEQLNNLPAKGKWILLFSCFFLVFFLAYRFNIKKAVQAVTAYRTLSKSAAQWNDSDLVTVQPVVMATGREQNDSSVLNNVSHYADEKGLVIEELAQRYDARTDTGTIETNKIVLQGPYVQLLQAVQYLEQQKMNAAVCSAMWELKSGSADNAPALLLTMYIKKLKNE